MLAMSAAMAIAGTFGLITAGVLDPDLTRYFRTARSPTGTVTGGLMFGYGMAPVPAREPRHKRPACSLNHRQTVQQLESSPGRSAPRRLSELVADAGNRDLGPGLKRRHVDDPDNGLLSAGDIENPGTADDAQVVRGRR